MKQHLQQLLITAIQSLQKQDAIPRDTQVSIHLERPRDKQNGDFACNVALTLAKIVGCKPRDLAEKIVANLPSSEFVQKVVIAGPGFINFFLSPNAWQGVVKEILATKENFGHSLRGESKPIHIEFVSSNPTGPLHVGHGRSAAYGATVADLLEAVGFKVHREYYVNDAGRQMDILAASVWLRYLQEQGETFDFPSNGYQGAYVVEIAKELKNTDGKIFYHPAAEVFKEIALDEPQGGDKELHIDGLIERAKLLLGETAYRRIFNLALETILTDIREDLAEFGVHYQEWFSERSLIESDAVNHTLEKLKAGGHLYEKDGAVWFNSSAFGDDKDRVVLRDNGQPTYFAVDAAYRLNLFERGYPHLINVLGADHHGYVPRIRAVIQALGYDPSLLTVLIVQFAVLYRGSERVQMSTRSGSFVTLRQLRQEVSTDAARFFYVLRKCEQHMDFDLELAKAQTNENPVYYVQYAHARICSVLRQLAEKKLSYDEKMGLQSLSQLNEEHELDLLKELARYPETLELAALQYEPHLLANYLRDLSMVFHGYYNSHTFLVDNVELRNARLALIKGTQQVIANGLHLLGVSAPAVM